MQSLWELPTRTSRPGAYLMREAISAHQGALMQQSDGNQAQSSAINVPVRMRPAIRRHSSAIKRNQRTGKDAPVCIHSHAWKCLELGVASEDSLAPAQPPRRPPRP